MLSLNSPEWTRLQHAFGSASDIPDMLRQLEMAPESLENEEPWTSVWSALAHQGDIYSATFAAVPHVVQIIWAKPTQISSCFFLFPAWVEICRQRKNVLAPTDFSTEYFESLSRLPRLIASAAGREWDSGFLAAAMSALAASKGSGFVAEAALELDPVTAVDFLDWFRSRQA